MTMDPHGKLGRAPAMLCISSRLALLSLGWRNGFAQRVACVRAPSSRQLSRKTIPMWLSRLLLLALVLDASTLLAASLPPVEPMPTIEAGVLVPARMLNDPRYTVNDRVAVVGYMGQFTLRAPGVVLKADGTEMLAIRAAELSAIAQLNQLSQSGVFADALAASAAKTGAAIGQAVLNPVQTLEGIPAGVGRFFQSATTTISRATESQRSNGSQGGSATGDDVLGINKAKRRIAKQVGADPYTTNPILAKQLDDLSRAAFAGGISLDVALAASTAGVATAISATATVSNLVWDRSPEDIRTIHEQKLTAMGVDAGTVRAFVTNRWLTPTLSVPLVENLGQLPAARGRVAVIALASTVESESEARYMLNSIRMARRAGTEGDSVVGLELAGRILTVRTRGGRVVVPAPVDYVVWTEQVRTFAEKRNAKGGNRDILVSGVASPRSREGLRATGWVVQEHSPDGATPR